MMNYTDFRTLNFPKRNMYMRYVHDKVKRYCHCAHAISNFCNKKLHAPMGFVLLLRYRYVNSTQSRIFCVHETYFDVHVFLNLPVFMLSK